MGNQNFVLPLKIIDILRQKSYLQYNFDVRTTMIHSD